MAFYNLLLALFIAPAPLIAEEVTQQASTTETKVLQQTFDPNANLVILGEDGHGNINIQRQNIESLSTLASEYKKFDCLFVELDDVSKAPIEAFMSGRSSYNESIGKFVDERGYAKNLFPENVANAARKLGIQVIPVDVNWQSPQGERIYRSIFQPQGYARIYINERNRIMAANIREQTREKSCTRSIFITGKYHADHILGETQLTPVQLHLSHYGFRTQVFNSTETSLNFIESVGL